MTDIPAFPRIRNHVDTLGCLRNEHDGMSLRDYFAGQALAGLLANDAQGGSWDMDAENAYRAADAMMWARSIASARNAEEG